VIKSTHPKPAQDNAVDQLTKCTAKIQRLKEIINRNLGDEDSLNELKKLRDEKKLILTKLNRLQQNAVANQELRVRKKRKLERLQELHPDEDLIKSGPGRYPIEHSQPGLHDVIIQIAMSNCEAHKKRQMESLNTCQTLDDLCEAVKEYGFRISRQGLYLRLLPKKANSTEGKRHVTTVPVKLIKATSTGRKKHPDSHFAMATVNYLKDLAKMMGPCSVFYLSQDDKCRVPLGLPAATKQSPFLMMMEYRVQLPDHDFVVAPRHKLIPSVYAAAKIDENGVTYSGPTYIAIRSGKHDSSTASTHAHDFDSLFDLNEFRDVIKTEDGLMKPIVIISVDGGPDENPR
jgi:hypothetical protein